MNKALVIKEENGKKAIYLYGFENMEEFAEEVMADIDANVDCYIVK